MNPSIGQKMKTLCVYMEFTDNIRTVAFYTPALNLGVILTSKNVNDFGRMEAISKSIQVDSCPDEVIRLAIMQHDGQCVKTQRVTISLEEELDRR